MRGRGGVLLFSLLMAAVPGPGSAQVSGNAGEAGSGATTIRDPETMPRPRTEAVRTHLPLTLDGVLDEAAWQEAVPFGDFVQSMPDAGAPATEPTVVRVLYDDENL